MMGKLLGWKSPAWAAAVLPFVFPAAASPGAGQGFAGNQGAEYRQRVNAVKRIPGFVALWDFVRRGEGGRFDAHQPPGSPWDFRLDALNYVREYWQEGRPATHADFPLLGRGPFGDAIEIREEPERDFRPCLLVPRARLHGSGLDIKGPNRSVSMVVWLVRRSGIHALAGIWHEGTDLPTADRPVARVERGQRQYALFAGLAPNPGGVAAHVSENGAGSFGDRYAHHLAVTPGVMATVPSGAKPEHLDGAWSAAGFVFDNRRNTVTAFLNGVAEEYWISDPREHRFYRWVYRAWLQARLHEIPGLQEGEDPEFPPDQYYSPPEKRWLERKVLTETPETRVELRRYPFTEVQVTLRKDARGKFRPSGVPQLVRLKVNPFWFPHDLYSPPDSGQGGPFTIGRVIHTSRNVGFTGYIGGVAVFNRALSARQMQELAAIGAPAPRGGPHSGVLEAARLQPEDSHIP